jgi:hypothetical protein
MLSNNLHFFFLLRTVDDAHTEYIQKVLQVIAFYEKALEEHRTRIRVLEVRNLYTADSSTEVLLWSIMSMFPVLMHEIFLTVTC